MDSFLRESLLENLCIWLVDVDFNWFRTTVVGGDFV